MDNEPKSKHDEPITRSALDERSRRIGKRLIAVAMVVLVLLLLGGGVAVWKLLYSPPKPVHVASFRADFQEGKPGPGWQYLWNPAAEIGKSEAYRPLVWNGVRYGPDDNPNFPRPEPGHYVRLSARGGHPGRGKAQRGTSDIYVIVGFAVTNQGYYWLTNSSLRRHDGDLKGNVALRVFVNDQPAGPEFLCSSKQGEPFDRALGDLKANDQVYVAVGPNEADTNDQFDMDFSLVMIPSKRR